MTRSITPNQIKQNNQNLIYQYIYKNKKVSQQDISYDLRLSRPTVTTNLTALEHDGLICKNGQIDTEFVGRKAAAYSIVPDFRISIGVEILNSEVKIIAIDLYGEEISHIVHEIIYENTEAYRKLVCDKILAFTDTLNIRDEQLLGIGLAMPGLVSPDRQTVLYGKILSCSGLSLEAFTRYLPYPCAFFHDSTSAAVSELWSSSDLHDAFYLSISKHLGSAVISKGEILTGKHGHNSTIEHIQMVPDGKLCYCGKHGCMETLCSLSALLNKNETLEVFFTNLRQKDPDTMKRWDVYLTNLARSINMLHLVHDTDFILGGHITPYLRSEDLTELHKKIGQMTPFEEEPDFLMISKMPRYNISIGAALPYIQMFLNERTGE